MKFGTAECSNDEMTLLPRLVYCGMLLLQMAGGNLRLNTGCSRRQQLGVVQSSTRATRSIGLTPWHLSIFKTGSERALLLRELAREDEQLEQARSAP
jgi:hypothetical protein